MRPICTSLSPGGVSCGACHCYLAARRHVSRRLVPHGTVLVFAVFPGDVHSCRFFFRFATTPKDQNRAEAAQDVEAVGLEETGRTANRRCNTNGPNSGMQLTDSAMLNPAVAFASRGNAFTAVAIAFLDTGRRYRDVAVSWPTKWYGVRKLSLRILFT